MFEHCLLKQDGIVFRCAGARLRGYNQLPSAPGMSQVLGTAHKWYHLAFLSTCSIQQRGVLLLLLPQQLPPTDFAHEQQHR
jgi:hypothetical protein